MTEEQKEKYANFLDNISEILGWNKPVDILRLCAVLDKYLRPIEKHIVELEKENAELKANNQFLNNLVREKEQRGLEIQEDLLRENEKLKEGLAVGSTWNKALEEERDKYRNMVFDKDEQLTKAKEIIEELYNIIPASMADYAKEPMEHARKFMTEE